MAMQDWITKWTCPNGHTVFTASHVFMGGADGRVAFNHDNGWHRCPDCHKAAFNNEISHAEAMELLGVRPTKEQETAMTKELVEHYITTIREVMDVPFVRYAE